MDILILNTFVHVNRRFVRAAQVLDKVHFLLFCSSYLFYVLVDFFFFLQGSTLHLEFLANYICELSLLDYSLLCYLPSLVAASSVFLAKYILMPIKNPWVYVPNLIFYEFLLLNLTFSSFTPKK